MRVDLNCDLGEGEPEDKTRDLMRLISSANIACGVHAGSRESMRTAVRLALGYGVHIGAHPGLPGSFGRSNSTIVVADLRGLLLHQINAMKEAALEAGCSLHHIKLHGTLYHLAEDNPAIAKVYLDAVRERWPGIVVYGRAGGLVQQIAPQTGVEVWPEAFLDRGYRDDGTLVPRSEPGALLAFPQLIKRLSDLLVDGHIKSINGVILEIPARTWCIHSDSPDSVACAEMARAVFSAFDLTSQKKRALISELTERYEINASSTKVHPPLG